MKKTEEEKKQAVRLAKLAATIKSHHDWWCFPEEGSIRGFLGSAPLFIVGDQPSTSLWESSHPNRRAFYNLLGSLGASNAHLTDLYKKRGRSGALRAGLPPDFDVHLAIFREELNILRPARIVALGKHSYILLATHVPEVKPILSRMWHFAYAVRYGRIEEWETNARTVIYGGGNAAAIDSSKDYTRVARFIRKGEVATQNESQRALMRRLYAQYGGDARKVIAAYASSETKGKVKRASNKSKKTAEEYARALLYDGLGKGWLR